MRKGLCALFILIFMVFINSGCNMGSWLIDREMPRTYFKINPITKTLSFEDTKNNDVSVEGLVINQKDGTCSLEKLTIKNNSSEVIDADEKRMAQIVEAQRVNVELHRAIGDNIRAAIAAGGEAAANFISKLPNLSATVDTPIGSLDVETESAHDEGVEENE